MGGKGENWSGALRPLSGCWRWICLEWVQDGCPLSPLPRSGQGVRGLAQTLLNNGWVYVWLQLGPHVLWGGILCLIFHICSWKDFSRTLPSPHGNMFVCGCMLVWGPAPPQHHQPAPGEGSGLESSRCP